MEKNPEDKNKKEEADVKALMTVKIVKFIELFGLDKVQGEVMAYGDDGPHEDEPQRILPAEVYAYRIFRAYQVELPEIGFLRSDPFDEELSRRMYFYNCKLVQSFLRRRVSDPFEDLFRLFANQPAHEGEKFPRLFALNDRGWLFPIQEGDFFVTLGMDDNEKLTNHVRVCHNNQLEKHV